MGCVGFRKLIEPHIDGNTIARIHSASGVARSTVERWVHRMHAAGECHIGRWERSAGSMAPVYRLGPGKDKARPAPLTGADYCRRHREKLKAEDQYETYLARKRAGVTVAKIRAGRLADPLVAALFGRAAA